MNLLLDTHMLLWAAGHPDQLSATAKRMISNGRNAIHFSVVSRWEIAIKRTLGRRDFRVDVRQLRRGLLEHGYFELPLTGRLAVSIDRLPDLHKDPFDRMLIAQVEAEGFVLLTADKELEGYGGPVRLVEQGEGRGRAGTGDCRHLGPRTGRTSPHFRKKRLHADPPCLLGSVK